MGLIQAALSAAGSTIRDQWKEYFYCDAIPADTIAVKGKKRVSGLASNYGNDNVITNGSVIAVADGQCMIIVEQGQVAEICAEPGEFRYDNSIAPSVFTGSLSDSVKTVFNEIGKRFEFGGQPSADQRVYYINTREILGNKYGTPNPVPFRVVDKNAGIDIDISLKCFGEYSFKVADPILFYTNVCANFAGEFKRTQIEEQMKVELLNALQPAFAKLSDKGLRYSALAAHTTELCDALKEELSAKWRDLRGIEIVSIGIASLKADEEDEKMLKAMQKAAAYKDPSLGAATYIEAKTQAMKDAANNPGGAGVGFMNLNMATQAGGDDLASIYAAAGTQKPAEQKDQWICPKCGTANSGKFCGECGTPRPGAAKWICPKCGSENDAKFCGNCGTKKPE